MSVKIRKMDLSDIPFVYKEETKIFGKSLGEKTLYNEIMYNDLSKYFMAIVNGERAGYVGSWLTIPNAEILNMFVSEKYRGLGIGYSLMERVIEICNDQEIVNITLEVRESNSYAIKLYNSLGFTQATVRKQYYADGENALLMIKKLGELS